MKSRESLLLVALGAALLAGGVVVWTSGGNNPTPDLGPRPAESGATEAEDDPDPPAEVVQALQPRFTSSDPVAPAVAEPPAWQGEGPPEFGIIDGSIRLTSAVAGRIQQYSVIVEEIVNPNVDQPRETPPFQRTWGRKAEPDDSPLVFTVSPVPFSSYGYRVSVYADGVNGSSEVVRLTESNWHADVTLSFTPGSVFSLRLIDQNRFPITERALGIRPVGLPHGRNVHEGTTDNFGTVRFDGVLAGDYDVMLDHQVRDTVTVTPPGVVQDEAGIGVQSALVTIPLGIDLKVEVFNAANFGVPGAEVSLRADSLDLREMTGRTDDAGVWVFQHVPPGRHVLRVRAAAVTGAGVSERTERVEIVEGQQPEPQRIYFR